MENVNESHDKPATPSTNVETPSPCKQNWIPKKKIKSCESVSCMVTLYKSGTNRQGKP
jgi:hypothetical protein